MKKVAKILSVALLLVACVGVWILHKPKGVSLSQERMVLAVSVIRMGTQQTLVQEMYCIETLARVDVLCLDKTGTITEGTMVVEDIVTIDETYNREHIGKLMKAYTNALDDNNPTFDAVRRFAETFEEDFNSRVENGEIDDSSKDAVYEIESKDIYNSKHSK